MPDSDKQYLQKLKGKWDRINFYSIIFSVGCLILGIIELAVMDFFTLVFTVIFLSVMGGLTLLGAAVALVSFRKLNFLKRRLLQFDTDNNNEA